MVIELTLLRVNIEQLIKNIKNETKNRHMNDFEYGQYEALNKVLEMIDEF